jgi:RNA polymerase sigma-70 factor, ECF subfamily
MNPLPSLDCAPSADAACGCVAPVFLEYEDRLRAFIGKRVKDKSQTDDLAHQVLLKLYAHCEQIPKVQHLKGWLYQITRNTMHDFFRENSRLVGLSPGEDLPAETEDAFAQEMLELVRPLIGLLPPEYAQPLLLSDLEGVPQKEVAKKLGLGLSATKSRIQRGREKLRALFTECCHLELDRQGNLIRAEIRSDCKPLQQKMAGLTATEAGKDGCC